MKKFFFLLSGLLLSLGILAQDSLIISEVADPGDHWDGRFVELYNASHNTIDLAAGQYYLYRQSNGDSTWSGIELTGTIAPGKTYIIAYSQTAFESYYGFTPDQTSIFISGNGDDAYFLYAGDTATGRLVDAFGEKYIDGTGELWEYTDGHAVRNSNIGVANPTWTASEWTITSPANTTDMTPGVHICDYPVVTPTKLVITNISHNPTYYGWEFSVTVQAQDDNGIPGKVSSNTQIQLNSDGTGTLANNTAVIDSGTNTVDLVVSYNAAETFNITASVVSGDSLATSTPVSMTINPQPTHPLSSTADTFIFDDNPTATLHDLGWYTYAVSGPLWSVSSYSGDYFMRISNYPSNEATESWVVLPQFLGADNPIGSFSSASYAPATVDQFKLKVSTDYPGYGNPNGYTWTDLTFTLPSGSYNWVKSGDINFSSFGAEFYVAFVFIMPDGQNNTIQVDSLIIYNQGSTTGINDIEKPSFTVYPNPVSSVLYVNASQGTLQILDNSGRIIKSISVNGHVSVDVADLAPGIYFARLNRQGQTQVRKFIKR